jgi:Tfp pilus assembly major pilin PilA
MSIRGISAAVQRQRGQGMTEYIIVVALIAIAAIGVYQFFGQTVRNQTAGIAMELSGQNAQGAVDNAQAAANDAQTQGNNVKTLGTYTNN